MNDNDASTVQPESAAQLKKQIRKTYRQRRNALSIEQQALAQRALLKQFLSIPECKSCDSLGAFLPNDGEISPVDIIQHCWSHKKRVALPVVSQEQQNIMVFHQYHADTHMLANRFGILEPESTQESRVSLDMLSHLIMPLVAFDATGNRLGMGGGYYDRAIAAVPAEQRPTLIGVAHDEQESTQLPTEPWDIPLDLIVTPSRIIRY